MNLTFSEHQQAIDLKFIDDCDSGQARAETCRETVADYARDVEAGDVFPPVLLVKVGVDEYRIADGYHRIRAHKSLGRETIQAQVAAGTAEDALIFGATEANRTNPKKPTRADKRRALSLLLRRPKFASLSDAELARRVGSTHPTVSKLRKLPAGKFTVQGPDLLKPGKSYELIFDDGKCGRLAELCWNPDSKHWYACLAVAAVDSIAMDGPERWPHDFFNDDLEGGRHYYANGPYAMCGDPGPIWGKTCMLVEVREFVAEHDEDEGSWNYRGGRSGLELHLRCKVLEGLYDWWERLSNDEREQVEAELNDPEASLSKWQLRKREDLIGLGLIPDSD